MKATITTEFEMKDIEDYNWDSGSDMETLVRALLKDEVNKAIREALKEDAIYKSMTQRAKRQILKEFREKFNV